MPDNSNPAADWFKWLVGTIIALLAAGGGIVALLNYSHSPRTLSSQSPPVTNSSPPAPTGSHSSAVPFRRLPGGGVEVLPPPPR